MKYLGVEYSQKHIPTLDPEFIPFGVWMDAYQQGATVPVAIAVERNEGFLSVRHAKIHGTAEMAAADYRFVERSSADTARAEISYVRRFRSARTLRLITPSV